MYVYIHSHLLYPFIYQWTLTCFCLQIVVNSSRKAVQKTYLQVKNRDRLREQTCDPEGKRE